MRSQAVFYAAPLLLMLGVSPNAQAQQLGDWHGDWHDVPQATCAPCKILGGGDAQGDDYDFTDPIPPNVVLNGSAGKGRVECSNGPGGNGCVFMTNQSVEVDNVRHTVFTHVRSRSTPTKVRAVVEVLQIK